MDFCVEREAAFSKSIYTRRGKRMLDLSSSIVGLLILSPVLAIIACYIKLAAPGPILYRQTRIGQHGHPFQILKFRSMLRDTSNRGPGITVSGDNRVTRAGRFLRRYKLDELPQLWNVFRGDMSLVGPRPELPQYVAGYTPEQRLVLSVRPGITDPASLAYRHEEELLASHHDPEAFYLSQVLPDKLARNLSYMQRTSFENDLRIILETVLSSLFSSAESKNNSTEMRSS
jgi:lipopolysaccharide/colanic/teichoic acid biosynthesis glycosyltransferase